jgi:hypothetical protein
MAFPRTQPSLDCFLPPVPHFPEQSPSTSGEVAIVSKCEVRAIRISDIGEIVDAYG